MSRAASPRQSAANSTSRPSKVASSAGLWTSLKVVADVADGSGTVQLDPDRVQPVIPLRDGGALAVTVMLLPGVSGSLMLLVSGQSAWIVRNILDLRGRPSLKVAGQITGVEGYVESIASGLVSAWLLAA